MKNSMIYIIIGTLIIIIIIAFLMLLLIPPLTSYESFVNNCELTYGNVAVPTLICPWYYKNCREDMSICECRTVDIAYKDIKHEIWVGCPT